MEAWVGGEDFVGIWAIYTGANLAPFGGIHEDGFRVRAVLGYGDYDTGRVSFAELLLGYHKQLGPLTLKVLAGMAVAEHRPREEHPAVEGTGLGGKGILEAWWNIADQYWLAADLAGALLEMERGSRVEYAGRIRLGWRFRPELSVGLEGGARGTPFVAPDRDVSRAGVFMRYEWMGTEVSVSGGLAVIDAFEDERQRATGPYGTVSVSTRF
jgi:hypothetical protein